MPELNLQNFRITYRYNGQSWQTVQQAFDRDTAILIFKTDNPHVEFESCDNGDGSNVAGQGAAKPYPAPAGCAPAYVCEQCGCGMSMLPPPEAIEEMKPRLLCPICLAGVQFDRHNEIMKRGR